MARLRGQTKDTKHCHPDERLRNWIDELLPLVNKYQKMKEGAGSFTEEDEKLRQNARSQKTKIMDDIIFQSMANLLYFFKTVEDNPALDEEFDDELRDLLGIRVDLEKEPYGRYAIDRHAMIFERLVESILCVRRQKPDDFRMILTDRLMLLLSFKLQFSKASNMYKQLHGMMFEDISRGLTWTRLRSSMVDEKDLNKQADRVMGFDYT